MCGFGVSCINFKGPSHMVASWHLCISFKGVTTSIPGHSNTKQLPSVIASINGHNGIGWPPNAIALISWTQVVRCSVNISTLVLGAQWCRTTTRCRYIDFLSIMGPNGRPMPLCSFPWHNRAKQPLIASISCAHQG